MAIIGIDLGTTNSACAIWEEGEIKLIPNRLGESLTPSVVGVDGNGEVVVGRTAKERLIRDSKANVAVFKRLMGTDHKIKLNRKEFSAVELSSLVLKSLKEDAESYLGEEVTEAVISVPAYFNDNQRHATKLAGELAGLKVERLINEPTAAAMAYGLHEIEEGVFLILDLGGGTFDVSILEFFDGIMEVHASAGDNFLGGEDFVEAMLEAILQEHDLSKAALSATELQRAYMQLETAKKRISPDKKQLLALTLAGKEVQCTVDMEWFVAVTTPLLIRLKKPIAQALKDADIPLEDITEVLLVGGSTRMQVFRSTIAKMFGRFPACNIDPDVVVAMGAAVQAGLKSRDAALDDVVLTDVCPYTLGTAILNDDSPEQGDYFMPIIERNTVVPSSIVRRVYTASENQKHLAIRVYQGESRYVKKNVFLGEVEVSVPKAPKGEQAADIRYSYDMNGLLEVDVTVVSTGKSINKVIQNAPGSLSQGDLEKSRARLAELKFHPRENEENSALLARAERLYETTLGEDRDQLAEIIAWFDRILEGQNPAEIQKAQKRMETLLDSIDTEDWI